MTLIFDIGNTNIKTAVFDGDAVVQEWRISTDLKRTGDEYFSLLRPLFRDANIDFSKITKKQKRIEGTHFKKYNSDIYIEKRT